MACRPFDHVFSPFSHSVSTKLNSKRKVLDGKVQNFSPTKISSFTYMSRDLTHCAVTASCLMACLCFLSFPFYFILLNLIFYSVQKNLDKEKPNYFAREKDAKLYSVQTWKITYWHRCFSQHRFYPWEILQQTVSSVIGRASKVSCYAVVKVSMVCRFYMCWC